MKDISATSKRIVAIDALRGFALLGILIVNIFVFHAPYSHYGEFYGPFTGWDAWALQQMIFFCGGKFMFLFAFLFGYGCWMQYEKYQDHQLFAQFWWRRMGLLAIFGIFHVLLLSFGDILLPYALLGMTLPFFLRLKNKTLVLLFLLVYCIPVYEFVLRQFLDFPSIFTQSKYSLEEYMQIHQSGSMWEIFQTRLYDYGTFRNEKLILYIPKEWSLFVIGIIAARHQLATDLDRRKGWLFVAFSLTITMIWWAYREQIIGVFDIENSIWQRSLLGLLIQSREFLHGMLYIIGFLLLWNLSFFQKLLYPFSYAGKMSLTNYLLQSLICAFLFLSYGLAYYGKLTPIQLILISCGIFLFQILFSYCWLKFNRFGPMEALWRKYSYR